CRASSCREGDVPDRSTPHHRGIIKMAKNKLKTQEIYRRDWVLQAANTVKVDIDSSVMPSGLIRGFWVKLSSAAITGTLTASPIFQQLLRGITFGAAVPKFNAMTAL